MLLKTRSYGNGKISVCQMYLLHCSPSRIGLQAYDFECTVRLSHRQPLTPLLRLQDMAQGQVCPDTQMHYTSPEKPTA